ncbi:PAS domain S-box protein [Aurantimonas aggregata]|uniref:Blue-light-activated histidine kinase n=1 Tax=Aurantimonas aggregata TaxID=2047720 RepID=A0A6L9MF74_9HYPH|nr:PAS domain S-box protein [Aurantimonas aggregata]NDV86437.1 PAS domain S-box protein [Aurantimonas aggregata]
MADQTMAVTASPSTLRFLEGTGDIRRLMRERDWSTSPLGEPQTWPQALRLTIALMLDSGLPMFVAWGPGLGFLYNDAYSRLLGNKHPSGLGERFQAVWPEIWTDIEPLIDKALAGEATMFENWPLVVNRHGYDETAYFTFSYSPVRDENGTTRGMLCGVAETTRQVEVERQLRESEARFRSMADSAPVMIWVTGPDGYCSYLNRPWYEYTGQTEVEGEGYGWLNATHPDDREEAEQAFHTANAAHLPFRVEYRLRRRDGAYRWAIDAARPRFGEDGSYLGYVGSVIDIHERREAEIALRESEDNYRHVVELNPQTTWTAGSDGWIDRVAERWREWTGSSGMGEAWGEALHPEDVEPSLVAWKQSLSTGEPYDVEHRARMVSGRYRWMHSRAYPRRDAEGQIVRWYGSTEDIHERKTGEEHLHLMINELNHRVKNSLATVQAIASQTFRNPASYERARDDFSHRLLALAQAHDVLTETSWTGATLQAVVDRALAAHRGAEGDGQITANGPPVNLTPKTALALSMALHELCTNASKYGALSVEDARVAIDWTEEGQPSDRRLRMTWREIGGPTVTAPTRKGFGTRLIEKSLAGELDGAVALSFEPDGVVCRIDVPSAGAA